MRKTIALCLLLCATPWAVGQTGAFDGQWTARFIAAEQPRQAKVVIQGEGGSWQTQYLPQGADICFKLEVPIEVSNATAHEITLRGRASKALAGCADGNPITFKRVDDNTLEGQFADGRPVKLVR
ncbi:hypothetical protein [Pseudorhodoferax sp.]|uniref:hypothetical protein n=1 Tax=Pseudorhodoferax sp. TaxID=1993553 RepID=UPI002DD68771|nr:hypothetical protein [Pseudorhodoferax sp.]